MMEAVPTLLDSVLQANRLFIKPNAFPPLPKNATRQLAIFTCMDTRLVDFLEPAMGNLTGFGDRPDCRARGGEHTRRDVGGEDVKIPT